MNRVCALIMLYNGRELSEIDAKRIVYEMQIIGLIDKPDDVTLVYKDADSIAKAIIAQEEHDEKNNNDATTLHFVVPEGKKPLAVKFIKDEFKLALAKAREVVETGCIVVEHPDYDKLFKEFCKIGVRVVKSFVRSKKEKEKFSKGNEDLLKSSEGAFGLVVLNMPDEGE